MEGEAEQGTAGEVEAEKERLEHDGAALNDKMAAAQHKLAELDEREHRVKTSEVLPHRVPCLHPVPCRRSPCIHQHWHHRRMCAVPSTRCWGSWLAHWATDQLTGSLTD